MPNEQKENGYQIPEDLSIPDFLRRDLHPELNQHKDDIAALEARDRERLLREQLELRKRLHEAKLHNRMMRLRNLKPAPGTVNHKILKALEDKLRT